MKKQGNMTPPIGHNNSLETGKKCARNKKKCPRSNSKEDTQIWIKIKSEVTG